MAKARKRAAAGLLRHVHVSHQLPAKLTCHLYITYVRPMMEYACPVRHSSASAANVLTLERVQASVARTILAADWDTPKDIFFRQLDWPSLRWRQTILSLTPFHQLAHHGEGPLACGMHVPTLIGDWPQCKEATSVDLGHGIVNKAPKRIILFSCYSVEHAPSEETGHNEPETVSCVSRRPLESAEVQPPPEPGPRCDALFQNLVTPLLSLPPLSLSLSLSLSFSLAFYLSIAS